MSILQLNGEEGKINYFFLLKTELKFLVPLGICIMTE